MSTKMKLRFFGTLLTVSVLFIICSCKKEDGNDLKHVTDIDGNIYNTITIGTQLWMKENLKATRYRNGVVIPEVIDGTEWTNLLTGAFCDYDNTQSNGTAYGKLYNFYAVIDPLNICPTGWHIPTDTEWTTLVTYLGGELVAGGKLKEEGFTHWEIPNTNATNESGFTALPGGSRGSLGFFDINLGGIWWSSSESSPSGAWDRFINFNSGDIGRGDAGKTAGFSVRCLKD